MQTPRIVLATAVALAVSLSPSVSCADAKARAADFRAENPSPETRRVADWVAETRDAGDYDFIIVDKKSARAFVFDAGARLRGASPVLVGAARSDDSVPYDGLRPIADLRVEERTTPAGRFVGQRGRNALGEDVVWFDYDNALSIHRVRAVTPGQGRLARLQTASAEDKRISYGCINVPVAFYERHVRPIFAKRRAIVYVLPEIKSIEQVFGRIGTVL